jgi:hypothetical protein
MTFDPNLVRDMTPEQKALQEKTDAFVQKWLSQTSVRPSLQGLASMMTVPPQGFDTWEDYYKYGDLFVPVSVVKKG